MWGSSVLRPPYEAHAFKGSLVKPLQSTVQPPHPVMLHVLLEEDLGMFSALSLCSALGTTALWGTVPQERMNINSFPITQRLRKIMQIVSLSGLFYFLHRNTKPKSAIWSRIVWCSDFLSLSACVHLWRESFFSVLVKRECKGNHIWEIMPLLMYNTTKTSPWICHQTKLQYW